MSTLLLRLKAAESRDQSVVH